MSRGRLLVVAGAVLMASACGTTVQGGSTLSAGTAGDGLGAAATDQAAVGTTDATVTGGAAPGAIGAVGAPGAGAAAAGSNGSTSAAAGGQTGTSGTVPTTTTASGPVRVGLLYIDGADSVASSLGVSGLSTGDAAAQARAIVKHLNATGGLHGRPIDLRYGKLDGNALASDPERTHAAACASLTEDQKVSYVVSYVQLTSNQLACYARRGVAVLDDQSSVPDQAGRQYARTFGSPGELALGRAATELVDALFRTGWLTSASKVGTFVYDTPDGVGLETRYLKPALARHGLTPAATARSSASADGANQNGTVLQFRSKGVDRVIPLGANPLFLMNAAEAQNYRPAYAMTSTFGPGALMEGAAPRQQLKNAAGIGWSKFLDVGEARRPGPVSANETLCFDVMKKNGQQSNSATVQALQAALCNVLMFLKASTDAHGVVPDVLDRVRAEGRPFPPADAFSIRMRPGQADGVAAYRDLAFKDDCSCFQYTGGNRATR